MTIAWNEFTPVASLLGGVLIGTSAVLLLSVLGRVAGITGILAGVLSPLSASSTVKKKSDWFWRAAFVAGLLIAPLAYRIFATMPEAHVDADWVTLSVAGILVGIGTRYGSGCTSGHGVCGLASLSPRSLVATITFMLFGFVTVWIVRHVLGA